MFAYIFFVYSGSNFFRIFEFYGEFWKKVDQKDTCNLRLYVFTGVWAKE